MGRNIEELRKKRKEFKSMSVEELKKWYEESMKQLVKELGEERYNKLYKEYEQQIIEDQKRHKPYLRMTLPDTGHTCGEYPNRPCEECFKAFPPEKDTVN